MKSKEVKCLTTGVVFKSEAACYISGIISRKLLKKALETGEEVAGLKFVYVEDIKNQPVMCFEDKDEFSSVEECAKEYDELTIEEIQASITYNKYIDKSIEAVMPGFLTFMYKENYDKLVNNEDYPLILEARNYFNSGEHNGERFCQDFNWKRVYVAANQLLPKHIETIEDNYSSIPETTVLSTDGYAIWLYKNLKPKLGNISDAKLKLSNGEIFTVKNLAKKFLLPQLAVCAYIKNIGYEVPEKFMKIWDIKLNDTN